jgi:hypothetical protein
MKSYISTFKKSGAKYDNSTFNSTFKKSGAKYDNSTFNSTFKKSGAKYDNSTFKKLKQSKMIMLLCVLDPLFLKLDYFKN